MELENLLDAATFITTIHEMLGMTDTGSHSTHLAVSEDMVENTLDTYYFLLYSTDC